ncbi:DUF2806 domain-containing protein [Rhizobium ruizarguesonis]
MAGVRADVEALDAAIESYRRLLKVSVPYDDIARLTVGRKGPTVSPRSFRHMRVGMKTTYERLSAIAEVLKADVETLIANESPSGSLAVVSDNNRQLDVYEEVVGALVDALVNGMIAQLGPEKQSDEEFYSEVTSKILSGTLAKEVQSENAKLFFAAARSPERELRFERNIRKIAEKSLPFLRDATSIETMPDQTWLDTYSTFAEKISDEDLQTLWGQVLAREFTDSGSISLKTLRVLQDLTKRQANLFAKLCGSVVLVSEDRAGKEDTHYLSIRLDGGMPDYLKLTGLDFPDLVELADFGLVTLGTRAFEADAGAWFTYFDKQFQITDKVAIRCNPLSSVGKELYHLAQGEKSEAYLKAVKKLFKNKVGPDEPVASKSKFR